MNPDNKKLICDKKRDLIYLLRIDCDRLLEVLHEKRVFRQETVDEIKAELNGTLRTGRLLRFLCNRGGPLSFDIFLETLKEFGLTDAVSLLKDFVPSDHETMSDIAGLSMLLEMDKAPPEAGDDVDSARDTVGTADGACSSRPAEGGDEVIITNPLNGVPVENYASLFVVKPADEIQSGPHTYPMAANPRGHCIIINNFEFAEDRIPTRHGSVDEVPYLQNIFQQLSFRVKTAHDLSAKEMEDLLALESKSPDLSDHDALVVIIMSHGNRGAVMGTDSLYLGVECIVGLFNNHNCPALRHKPKMFFIQACRGDDFDFGVEDLQSAYDAVPHPNTIPLSDKTLPTWTDTLLCYSTIDGYVSQRNSVTGSWFGEALGRALIEHSHDHELHQLLIKVSNKVSTREGAGRAKQPIEMIYRGWQKSLFFNPGHNSI